MKIEKIDRIALGVADLEKASRFFSDLLGIEFDPPGEGEEEIGLRGRYSALGLELTAPYGHGDSVIKRFIEKRGEGVFCVVLKVDNLDEALKHFTDRGLRVMGDTRKWMDNPKFKEVAFHPKDSYGMQIVLAEYEALHPATYARLRYEPAD